MYNIGYNSKKFGFKTSENKKWTKCYRTWRNMFKRCYDEKYHKYSPSYIECVVCEEWHDFQNFAKWYSENEYLCVDNISLDKDLKIPENKLYSPNTCVLLPEPLNKVLVNTTKSKGKYPLGVSYHKHNKKYVSYLHTNEGRKTLGYFDNPDLAYETYVKAKEEYIQYLAKQYKEILPSNTYTLLINYKIRR